MIEDQARWTAWVMDRSPLEGILALAVVALVIVLAWAWRRAATTAARIRAQVREEEIERLGQQWVNVAKRLGDLVDQLAKVVASNTMAYLLVLSEAATANRMARDFRKALELALQLVAQGVAVILRPGVSLPDKAAIVALLEAALRQVVDLTRIARAHQTTRAALEEAAAQLAGAAASDEARRLAEAIDKARRDLAERGP